MTKLPAPWGFSLLCCISLVVAWRPCAATFYLALNREEYTHILLILPVAAALVFLERSLFKSPSPAGSWGFPILAGSLAIAALAKFGSGIPPDTHLSLAMLALVMWWAGAFVLCFGNRVARAFLFPLLFLLWIVPIPAFLLGRIVTFLQAWSAFSAQVLFSAVGVPVSQDGFFLTIPGLTLEVAKECSSIRSSLMLVVITMVLAQLELRSLWRKLLVVSLAVPLSIAKNGLRIFTIAMLGTKVDPAYLTGRLHHQGGVIFLTIALLVIFFLLWILRRGEHHHANAMALAGPARSTHP